MKKCRERKTKCKRYNAMNKEMKNLKIGKRRCRQKKSRKERRMRKIENAKEKISIICENGEVL